MGTINVLRGKVTQHVLLPVYSLLFVLREIFDTFHTLKIKVEWNNFIWPLVVRSVELIIASIIALEEFLVFLGKQRNSNSIVFNFELVDLLLLDLLKLPLSLVSPLSNDLLLLGSSFLLLSTNGEGFFLENNFALLVNIYI